MRLDGPRSHGSSHRLGECGGNLFRLFWGCSLESVQVVHQEVDDVCLLALEEEMFAAKGPLLKKIKNKLLQNRILNILHLNKMNNMTCIIFKEIPDDSVLNELKRNNFKIISLPRNPYL
ncbi:MAG: hypothetical protein WCG45_05500 [bacterium]